MKRRRRNGGRRKDQKAPEAGNGVSQLSLMELPTAVLHEIFFRLPVNSIMKAKFVCIGLYKLLSDPEFAVNYTKNSPFSTILLPRYRYTDIVDLPVVTLVEISENYKCFRTAFKPKIPGRVETESSLSLERTCDGLLCFSLRKPAAEIVYICNPFMGDCVGLPEHENKIGERFSLVYGFGFCLSTNKYKVLRVTYNPSHKVPKGQGEIFTIGVDDRWRSLANPAVPVTFALCDMVPLNGVLHWLFSGGGQPACINTFDLGEERLGQIPHPPGLVMNFHTMRLTLLSNQLSLVDSSSRSRMVLWKMKEHASEKFWTKDIILDISFPDDVSFRGLNPLTISRNGDIIFCHPWNDFVLSYNPEKRRCTKIEVSDRGRMAYTPNLLSLKELIAGQYWSKMNALSK